jgi:hypothetical protein
MSVNLHILLFFLTFFIFLLVVKKKEKESRVYGKSKSHHGCGCFAAT